MIAARRRSLKSWARVDVMCSGAAVHEPPFDFALPLPGQ
jgi:hypothetical protein